MNKNKIVLTAFAVFASILMLMSTAVAGPIRENTISNISNDLDIKGIRLLDSAKCLADIFANDPYIGELAARKNYRDLESYVNSKYSDKLSELDAASKDFTDGAAKYYQENPNAVTVSSVQPQFSQASIIITGLNIPSFAAIPLVLFNPTDPEGTSTDDPQDDPEDGDLPQWLIIAIYAMLTFAALFGVAGVVSVLSGILANFFNGIATATFNAMVAFAAGLIVTYFGGSILAYIQAIQQGLGI